MAKLTKLKFPRNPIPNIRLVRRGCHSLLKYFLILKVMLPPSQNLVAPPNGVHHEAILEGEFSHRPFTRTQYQPRERVPQRDALRGPWEDLIDSEDNSLLAINLMNAPLLKFKFPFLEQYDRSRDSDDHLQNYRNAMQLHGATEALLC